MMLNKSIIIFLLFLTFSCKNEKSNEQFILDPLFSTNTLATDFEGWWGYHYNYINLSSDFIGLGSNYDTISKEVFLKKLVSGSYIPLRLKSDHVTDTYKLYALDPSEIDNIGETIKNEALTTQYHFKMEGRDFPKFDFVDINNVQYNNESIKGSIFVLKTWFIGCTACINEFPELNKVVDEYSMQNDIKFVSLALDSKSDLENFLSKKLFKYEVVPNQKKFIASQLDLNVYPTHIIVDKNGKILKVVNRASNMISFLKNFYPPKAPPPPPPS